MSNTNMTLSNSSGAKSQHWTAQSADAFAHKVAFDFIAQVEEAMQERGITRAELAENLGVSQSSVSQVLNNPQNLTLKTIARYCQRLSLKVAVVAYEDEELTKSAGMINPQVFKTCWIKLGMPLDVQEVEENCHAHANNQGYCLHSSTTENFGLKIDYIQGSTDQGSTGQGPNISLIFSKCVNKTMTAFPLSWTPARTFAAIHLKEVTKNG